jgi:hypothetical protein
MIILWDIIKIYHTLIKIMGASINGGTPIAEWFVVVDNPIKVDDLGILCCNCNKLQKPQVSSASGKHPSASIVFVDVHNC